MRDCLLCVSVALLLACSGLAQQAATKNATEPDSAKAGKPTGEPTESELKAMFEAKVKAEWEALKKKDAKAYGELLADDYEGVELDGQGERTKRQSVSEVPNGNVANYTLWGFKLIPLGPDAAFLIYEVTIEFPPRSALRYSRMYITELWVKRKGEWKELHYQETHVK